MIGAIGVYVILPLLLVVVAIVDVATFLVLRASAAFLFPFRRSERRRRERREAFVRDLHRLLERETSDLGNRLA